MWWCRGAHRCTAHQPLVVMCVCRACGGRARHHMRRTDHTPECRAGRIDWQRPTLKVHAIKIHQLPATPWLHRIDFPANLRYTYAVQLDDFRCDQQWHSEVLCSLLHIGNDGDVRRDVGSIDLVLATLDGQSMVTLVFRCYFNGSPLGRSSTNLDNISTKPC